MTCDAKKKRVEHCGTFVTASHMAHPSSWLMLCPVLWRALLPVAAMVHVLFNKKDGIDVVLMLSCMFSFQCCCRSSGVTCHANATRHLPTEASQHLSATPCGIRFLSNAWGAMSSSLRAVQLGSYCRSQSLPGGSQRVHWQNAWTLPRFEKHLTLAKTLEDSMRMLGLADLATTGVLCSCHEIHNAYHRYHSWAVRVQKTPSSKVLESWAIAS